MLKSSSPCLKRNQDRKPIFTKFIVIEYTSLFVALNTRSSDFQDLLPDTDITFKLLNVIL